jgi:hypothetical protein
LADESNAAWAHAKLGTSPECQHRAACRVQTRTLAEIGASGGLPGLLEAAALAVAVALVHQPEAVEGEVLVVMLDGVHGW